MVRKWSYINKDLSNFNFLQTTSLTFKTISRFKFKIFRNTTRFKSYNIGHTAFTRTQPAIQKRRSTWKSYLILSSDWVKPLLSYKKVVGFIQTKSMFHVSVPYPYIHFFKKNIIPITKVGLGQLNFNYSQLSKTYYSKFFLTNSKRSLFKNLKFFKYSSLVQLKSYNSVISLKKLGFLLTFTTYNNLFFQITQGKNQLTTNNTYKLVNSIWPPLVIKTLFITRLIFVLTTLYRINKI
jgi:hypothetical protein